MAPPDGPDPLDVEEHPFGGAAIGTAPIGGKPVADQTATVDAGQVAVAGQAISFEYRLAATPAQLAFAGQVVRPSTPKMPVVHGELAVSGQAVTFEIAFNIAEAQVAFAGQQVTYEGILEIEHAEIAVAGQSVPAVVVFASLSPGQVVFEGQNAFSIIDTMPVVVQQVALEGQAITFRMSVKPQLDRYPYCGRSGFRVALSDLVEDGRIPGLYVEKGWDDDIHPQDWPQHFGADGARFDRSAPSQDPVEEYEQVVLVVDGESIEV